MSVDNMDNVIRTTGGYFRKEIWDIIRKANGF